MWNPVWGLLDASEPYQNKFTTNAYFEYVFLHGPATNNKGGRPPKHSASALPISPSISKSSYCAHFSAVKDVNVLLSYPPPQPQQGLQGRVEKSMKTPVRRLFRLSAFTLIPPSTYSQKDYCRVVRFASASFAPGNLKE
jgi:hypothetical protein